MLAFENNGWLKRLLAKLEPDVAAFIGADWLLWARDNQLPPVLCEGEAGWRTWLLIGGRGAGKTRAGAEWVRAQALGEPPLGGAPVGRIALVGQTLADVRSVMVEGVSGLLAVHNDANRPKFEPSKKTLTWPNGSIAQMFSADEPEGLRGPQFSAAWSDEICKWRYANEAWDMLQFGLRIGRNPRQVVTTTPRNMPLLKHILEDPGTVFSHARTEDNVAHLSDAFITSIKARYGGSWLGRQELDGEILEDREDALWQRHWFDERRVRTFPELTRIVVALDPPVTSGSSSDACGIVVSGLGVDGRAYVLDDCTCQRVRPLEWARAGIRAYHEYEADALVAEVNQGGELVATVIAQIDASVPVKQVRATRGKWVRAEPVATLYAQGRVSHAGTFPELEDQLCDFGANGLSGGRSPDRLDALVWSLTELMCGANEIPRITTL